MPKMELPEELLTGVTAIDMQHQQWMRHYNDFVDAIEKGDGPESILSALGFLVDYTEFHFFCEERKMDETRYPAAAAHKQQHQQMRERLSAIVEQYSDNGSSPRLAASILSFLNDWFAKHIGNTDAPLGAYLRARPK